MCILEVDPKVLNRFPLGKPPCPEDMDPTDSPIHSPAEIFSRLRVDGRDLDKWKPQELVAFCLKSRGGLRLCVKGMAPSKSGGNPLTQGRRPKERRFAAVMSHDLRLMTLKSKRVLQVTCKIANGE